MNTHLILEQLVQGVHLTPEQSGAIMRGIIDGSVSPVVAASILTAVRMKGETPDEIIGFVRAIQKVMIPVSTEGAVDVCGTGGDGSNSFNISTAVAFVAAGAGASVAKHGNRAASSACGSADVLEALGIRLETSPEQATMILKKIGMVFLFAPSYHPALKQLAAVRRELKIRTVANLLGPLLNPARVRRQLIGVPNTEVAEKLIAAAACMDYEHLIVATSGEMDEISLSGETRIYELRNGNVSKYDIHPRRYGFLEAPKAVFTGGNAEKNAAILQAILKGKKGPTRDIVVLNTGFALYCAGVAKNPEEGIRKAAESINSGAALRVLTRLQAEGGRDA